MSLFATLNLKPPKNFQPRGGAAKPDGAAADPAKAEAALVQRMNTLFKEAGELSARATTPDQKEAAAAAQKQMAEVMKVAESARKAAQSMKVAADRAEALKVATETMQVQGRKVMEKHLPMVMGAIDLANALSPKKPKEDPDRPGWHKEGEVKNKPIISKDALGAGRSVEGALANKDAKGNAITVKGGFGGKSWVDWKEKPLIDPPEYELSFHMSFEVEASLAGKLKSGAGFKIDAGKEIKISITHEVKGQPQKDAYLAAVQGGRGLGGFPELQLADALTHQRVETMQSLMAAVRSLGGSVGGLLDMADGDVVELEGTEKLGASAGANGSKNFAQLAAKFGVQVGTSRVGTVTRTVKRSGSKWVFEYAASDQSSDNAAASASYAGVGGGVAVSQSSQHVVQMSFEVPETHPQLRETLERIAAADSLEALKALRTQLKGVRWTLAEGQAGGSGHGVSAKGAVADVALAFSQERGHAVAETSDGGKLTSESGANKRGGALGVLGQDLVGDSRKQSYTGAADQNNVGTGDLNQTDESFDIIESGKKLLKSPLAALGVITNDEELLDKKKHQEGVSLSDADFGSLAELAKDKRDWDHFLGYCGDSKSMLAWTEMRQRVIGGNRASINAAFADFESHGGSGLHEAVRAALNRKSSTPTAQEYEFPASISKYKDMYEGFVRADPMEEVREAGDAARMRKKFSDLEQQMVKLTSEITKHANEFRSPDLSIRMCKEIDAVLTRFRREGRKLLKETEAAQSIESAPGEDKAQAQEEVEARIQALKRDIGSAHIVEGEQFKAWEEELDSFFGANTKKVLAFRSRMMKLHSDWRGLILDLRQVLKDAGPSYDPREADLVKPDNDKLQSLIRRSRLN